MNYAMSSTGLFHLVDKGAAATLCGSAVVWEVSQIKHETDAVVSERHPIQDEQALDWLAEHPWDLCRTCKAAAP